MMINNTFEVKKEVLLAVEEIEETSTSVSLKKSNQTGLVSQKPHQ